MITQKKRQAWDEVQMPDGTWLPVPPEPVTIKETFTAIESKVMEGVTFGPELLDEVIKEPTLNFYLDRSPKLNQPKDYAEVVRILQHKRALFITAEQKKKEPKIEGED